MFKPLTWKSCIIKTNSTPPLVCPRQAKGNINLEECLHCLTNRCQLCHPLSRQNFYVNHREKKQHKTLNECFPVVFYFHTRKVSTFYMTITQHSTSSKERHLEFENYVFTLVWYEESLFRDLLSCEQTSEGP